MARPWTLSAPRALQVERATTTCQWRAQPAPVPRDVSIHGLAGLIDVAASGITYSHHRWFDKHTPPNVERPDSCAGNAAAHGVLPITARSAPPAHSGLVCRRHAAMKFASLQAGLYVITLIGRDVRRRRFRPAFASQRAAERFATGRSFAHRLPCRINSSHRRALVVVASRVEARISRFHYASGTPTHIAGTGHIMSSAGD